MAGETPQPPEAPQSEPAAPLSMPTQASVEGAVAEEKQDLAAEERHSPARFWLKVAALVFAVGYSVAFVVGNSKRIHVDFVFGSANVTLIWSILLLLLIGFAAGLLASHLYRHRRRKKPGKP